MSQSKERSHAPCGSNCEDSQKRCTDEMIRSRTFAPALEHSNRSNDKQYDGTRAKNLEEQADVAGRS